MAIKQRIIFDLSPEEVERFDRYMQEAGMRYRIEFFRFLLREYERQQKKQSEKN